MNFEPSGFAKHPSFNIDSINGCLLLPCLPRLPHILGRVLKRVRKNNHSGGERERETCRTTSNRSRRWISVVWPRKRSTRATNGGKSTLVINVE